MNWTEILYPVAWLWKPKLYLTFLFFVAAAYLLIVFIWYYSDGDQAGYLQKFSRKGWVCKTYEGELAMTTVPGVAPTIWDFSVRDESVAREVRDAIGKRVILHYTEHKGIPTRLFGETNYFVDSVRVEE